MTFDHCVVLTNVRCLAPAHATIGRAPAHV
jgi:hypothetical protein